MLIALYAQQSGIEDTSSDGARKEFTHQRDLQYHRADNIYPVTTNITAL